ncbi:MAG TPA: hypothetical protein VKP12_09925, partial [Kiloniellaceae bacterium]|nr:hypothetical protein [Kiloniellaceae bacterium]
AQDPAAAQSVLDWLEQAAAGERRLETALRELRGLLADRESLEPRARQVVELLARTAAAALLLAHAPAAVAEGFLAGRLDGGFRHTYGAGAAGADCRAILERALPA